MAGPREALAATLATRFGGEGIEPETATYLANAVAARATFDMLGAAVDLGAIVAGVKADNADLIGSIAPAAEKDSSANPWKPGATFSITRQCVLTAADPQLADRLRAEAGE